MLGELLRWARWRRSTGIVEVPWRAWARSLVTRRFRVVGAQPAPAMRLALASVPATRARFELAVHRLQPRIELSIRAFSTSAAHTTVLAPAAGTRRSSELGVSPVVGEVWRTTVRRIVEERRRVELPVQRLAEPAAESYRSALPAGFATPESALVRLRRRDRRWLEQAPVPRLPALLQAAAPRGGGDAASEVTGASDEASRGAPQPTFPEVDLERLTDQVVRQIDRRIVAHRERVGRI